jgi:hypothetical protein|uniref:Uncharacterized protein n=1 Tax=Zea mays TaxID=4577 RepID=C4J0D9_MAIZE|nr:unknown [Zea mays]
MCGDEASAAHRRGPGLLRRRLPRRPHLRSEPEGGSDGGSSGCRGRAGAGVRRQPHGEDRGAGPGARAAAAGLGGRAHALSLLLHAGVPCAGAQPLLRTVHVRELGRVPGDLGLQPRRLFPAFRGRRRRCRAVRVRGSHVSDRQSRRRVSRGPRHLCLKLLSVICWM